MIRHQLTLFVPEDVSAGIEAARRLLDPVQHALIAAHVTLCREDELIGIEDDWLIERAVRASPIELRFGTAERFMGHGVQLPCVDGEPAFHALRCQMLGSTEVRRQQPHITLAHPRNPRAPANSGECDELVESGLVLRFAEVVLIRQIGQDPWQETRRFTLSGPG